jgi:hypothetical protein
MATQAQKFEAIKNATNAVGGANGVFKHLTKTEAILFIRQVMYLASDTSQGFDCVNDFDYATVTLLSTIEQRDLADAS